MGGNASEWSFASGTPWAISAMGGTSDWWVPNPENHRMVVANTAPVMMAKPRHALSERTHRRSSDRRHRLGYLRYGGHVRLVGSEPRKPPDGRRKYCACNDGKATARHIRADAPTLFRSPAPLGLSPLWGARPIGGFRTQKTTGWSSQILRL